MELPIKALSIRQPWAWAIIHGGKDIENRTTFAVNKGDMKPKRICVHASQGMTRDEYEDTRHFMRLQGLECPRPDELIRGGIIGIVTVIDVVTKSESPWFFGPRGLVLADAMPIDPISAKGALGYFDWKEGGNLQEPLPWMKAWPDEYRRPKAKRREPEIAPAPLFDATP